MAVTDGPGNGFWTRDETILALDLYLQAGKALDSKDSRVVSLSEYLRSLPLHPPDKRKGSFRNPASVAFKIGNLRAVQTGKGLKNVSAIDKEVWAELGTHPNQVRALANEIRQACSQLEALPTALTADSEGDDASYFREGGAAVVLHRRLERNPKLRDNLLKARQRQGELRCDACERASMILDPDLTTAAFEAHHVHPLAVTGATKTRAMDMALLCATCHRLIHRAMVVQKRWLSLSQFRSLIQSKLHGARG